ncbi:MULTISPECIES: FeoA family protein [Thermococcus]|uniref:Ferrous iron transporter FeoA-like domain-containing protein n=1 Tax=Thermococcus eurythermalis TaxID=1505907 RepID=A0A097QV42_9EURY|nr:MULTISPECIES: FeoA family protein [Thermococcus]AIU70345.1 hypothetical protein TEU_08380 [Thermococcus eurythermalis]NJE60923.1 ferrous iron transport protein A [Thermococcus sp. 21S7]
MRLDEVPVGSTVRVRKLCGGPILKFMEMGVLPGTEVRVLKKAPLGDPIEVELRGYRLSLRKEEAECLEVVPCGSP